MVELESESEMERTVISAGKDSEKIETDVDQITLERIRREAFTVGNMDDSRASMKLLIEWQARWIMQRGLT